MHELLAGFAALSLLSGALTALLPEGTLRRTACMVVGLLMLTYWYTGLQKLGGWLPGMDAVPDSPLASTGLALPGGWEGTP